MVVILLHVSAIAVLASHRLTANKINTLPIAVHFPESPPRARETQPPPPTVRIERSVPTVVAPEWPDLAPAQRTISTTPAIATPVANTQPPDTTPITPARFDADYLNNPPPTYPSLSRRMREQGTVILRVRVREDGLAAEVDLHHGSGHRRLDEAAMKAVRHWRFIPARRGENVIESWVLVPIEFSLHT
jgi:protein TonB